MEEEREEGRSVENSKVSTHWTPANPSFIIGRSLHVFTLLNFTSALSSFLVIYKSLAQRVYIHIINLCILNHTITRSPNQYVYIEKYTFILFFYSLFLWKLWSWSNGSTKTCNICAIKMNQLHTSKINSTSKNIYSNNFASFANIFFHWK